MYNKKYLHAKKYLQPKMVGLGNGNKLLQQSNRSFF